MYMRSVITDNRIKIAVVFLLFVMMVSCAADKRYKVLAIFFDGVPKPGTREEQKQSETKPGEQPGEDEAARQKRKIVIRIRSRHPDYEERNCDNCHDRSASNFLRTRSDRICFECHDEDEFTDTFVHGPIAVGGCMVCHLPHESQYDKLLIANSREICLYCHQAENVALNPAHSGLSLAAGSGGQQEQDDRREQPGLCTPCHDPHKGKNRFFLRKAPLPTLPAVSAEQEVPGTGINWND
jgi:predicted CXXCH cytochrome family protein